MVGSELLIAINPVLLIRNFILVSNKKHRCRTIIRGISPLSYVGFELITFREQRVCRDDLSDLAIRALLVQLQQAH